AEEKFEQLKKEKREEQFQRIQNRLQEFAKRELKDEPEGLDIVGSVRVVEGDPTTEILKKIDELNCDILIIGAHGKGWLAQTFLGSVAEKILHRVRKPVYIIPLPEGQTDMTFKD
ncbi:MAG: universal stress protein, partial [Deltaproteobacteria bacterium]|nr:universal stress protein [Deltaproteobacteria bacterium]